MIIKIRIIIDKHIVDDHFLNNRMSSAFDIDRSVLIDLRTAVIILTCDQSERNEDIDLRDCLGSLLDSGYVCSNLITDFSEQIVFEIHKPVLRSKNGILQFLEFRRNVSLRIRQCLLSHIIIRHQILKGIRYFQIIPEYFVIFNTQILDSGLLFFRRLEICQPLLTVC